MKKKLLSMAVVAAFAGGATTAQAVHVNPDGLGQVLIYPFYSVEGGNDTYINIVNTTNQVKAVKVRFLEGMNSQEVLDFNLYLSPFDHWSAAVTRGAGEAAIMRTADNSCTVPAIPGQWRGLPELRVLRRSGRRTAWIAPGKATWKSSRWVWSMALSAANATHDNGRCTPYLPVTCVTPGQSGNTWANNPSPQMDLPASGGLYGYGVLINVPEGTNGTYSATAIDGYTSLIVHTDPGSLTPSLAGADDVSFVFSDGDIVEFDWFGTDPSPGLNAVSSVLMKNAIMNDFVLDPGLAAGTDWVVTFPTKRDYVNVAAPAWPPFTAVWDEDTSRACEPVGIAYWDREEATEQPEGLDFSPQPPGTPPQSLCAEANVVTFDGSNVLSGSDRVSRNLDVVFDNGWMRMNFDNSAARVLTDDFGQEIYGLPVIGFAVQKYVNGDLDGLLSNYAGLIDHKATVSVSGIGIVD
jgi:hypothetical protein